MRDEFKTSRLRVIVFTSGPLSAVNRVFFERLAGDPLVELCAIIVDAYERAKKPLPSRVLKGLREEGWGWLAFKLRSAVAALVGKMVRRFFEWLHPPVGADESYETLQQKTGIPVYCVPDIHDEQSLALIKSLRPKLGVIVGSRILRDAVITIPDHGTLNIHKRKVPDYRGGGPVGYWEVLAGEASIGVTIHYALSKVDSGAVLAESSIPIEECDTLESLQIKADILGANLYHETIRKCALGSWEGVPQDTSRGKTYRAPSEFRVWQLQKRLSQNAAKRMPGMEGCLSWPARMRIMLQYGILLPWLMRLRKRLKEDRRAPICIFFYHLVTNRPVNHLCLSLEDFVRQMEFLRRYYKVLSLQDAVRRLESGETDEIAVALTFDDGYKDNTWAIEYLRYFGVPAAFFVSIGHILDGSGFEHDTSKGFKEALPMGEADVGRLAAEGFVIGSHGVYHEDFGQLDPAKADEVLRESRELINRVTGRLPEHFSFPKGQRGSNITGEGFALANRHYRYVYSAYGGYNFPSRERRHFLRIANPSDVLSLAMIMDGYTGFRRCLSGDAVGLKTESLPPYCENEI
ncbi:MAG: polysaccharide deacetylase family protein [Deltaproteobacteria bacterium]|nr:polysaccharide deacetylase family protein [Deltaproteobacteria bacterium]